MDVRFGFQLHSDRGRFTGIGRAAISREVDEVERRMLAAIFARKLESELATAVLGDGDYVAALERTVTRLAELPVADVELERFVRIKLQNAAGELVFEHGERGSTQA